MLTRLQATAKIDDNTSAFIQLQANSRWGSQNNGSAGTSRSASVPLSGNDTTTDVGIHQAYFTLNKLFGAPVDLKMGRQEIILDGHRLFGNTVWTQGMMSHDALRLTHKHDKMTLSYIFSKFNHLEWWKNVGRVKYSIIYFVAPSHMAIPSSNGFLEHIFSTCTWFDDVLATSETWLYSWL